MDDLLEMLTIDDLNDTQRDLAECIGFESYIALVRRFAGESICVPMPASIAVEARNRLILAEYNGYNTTALGKKYQLAECTIRSIIRNSGLRNRNEPPPGQLSFFDKPL